MKNQLELKNILKKHRLRITECRTDVLKFSLNQNRAFSFKNMEDAFQQYDRVTLYRTLNSFTENGLLHKIPSDTGTVNYGLCSTSCSPKSHKHEHIHFQCNSCGKTECLPKKNIPHVDIAGYVIEEVNMIVSGICSKCV